jgi:hypothetical protein
MATTTNYGWETPDDTDLVKDGALAQRTTANSIDSTLGTALNNKLHAGLVLVKTQTIGTGVSSVTVTSAFSSTYDNYLIQIFGGAASTNNEILLQLSGITTGVYYSNLLYSSYGATTPLAAQASAATQFSWCGNGGTSDISSYVILTNPFATKPKTYSSKYTSFNTGGVAGTVNGFCNSSISASGFTISATTGTFTGGTIAVYGYAKD